MDAAFYARVGTLAQTITPMKPSHLNLFYSWTEKENTIETACIGHLRGDFGSGTEFWTTWWPHTYEEQFKTQDFKDELDNLVNTLRKEGLLKDLSSMKKYCASNPQAKFEQDYYITQSRAEMKVETEFIYGFEFVSEKHVYMLRCFPAPKDYNFYLYCYNKQKLKELEIGKDF